jgi:hypothetical protein
MDGQTFRISVVWIVAWVLAIGQPLLSVGDQILMFAQVPSGLITSVEAIEPAGCYVQALAIDREGNIHMTGFCDRVEMVAPNKTLLYAKLGKDGQTLARYINEEKTRGVVSLTPTANGEAIVRFLHWVRWESQVLIFDRNAKPLKLVERLPEYGPMIVDSTGSISLLSGQGPSIVQIGPDGEVARRHQRNKGEPYVGHFYEVKLLGTSQLWFGWHHGRPGNLHETPWVLTDSIGFAVTDMDLNFVHPPTEVRTADVAEAAIVGVNLKQMHAINSGNEVLAFVTHESDGEPVTYRIRFDQSGRPMAKTPREIIRQVSYEDARNVGAIIQLEIVRDKMSPNKIIDNYLYGFTADGGILYERLPRLIKQPPRK